jgi:hypothetical protein
MGHQKQGSTIRQPYLGRVEPGADIEGWFLNMGHQNQGPSIRESYLGRVEPGGLILRTGSSIREPYLGRKEPGADIEGWFLNMGHQNQGSSIREPYLAG